jgi:hypothetical protein
MHHLAAGCAVALRALEHGADVTISEASEYLATCNEGSLGGLVLSGVIDRLPLPGVIPLLAQARRALAPGAPLVVVSAAPTGPPHGEPITDDLVDGRSLHRQTWGLLLERSGFVDVDVDGLATQTAQVERDDQRFGVTATTPST